MGHPYPASYTFFKNAGSNRSFYSTYDKITGFTNKTKQRVNVEKQNLRFQEKSKRPLPNCPSAPRALTPSPTYLCHKLIHPRSTRDAHGKWTTRATREGRSETGWERARRGAHAQPYFRYSFIASPRLESARLDYKHARALVLVHLSLPGARRGRGVVIRVHLLLQQLHARRSLG